MQSGDAKEVNRIILTASGGPFRGATAEQIQNVTIEQALAHPTWNMGKKITIDSATMMNKALEVIEARWLFDVPVEKIEVLIHPESIVHSMVEFVDGSIIAQMSDAGYVSADTICPDISKKGKGNNKTSEARADWQTDL